MINIRIRVRNLIRKYGTRDPEAIAKEEGIIIKREPYKKLMGFFKKMLGKKFIVVNSNLPEWLQRMVIAHELGHALLHSSKEDEYIHEYTHIPRTRAEIEAHKFAAELLINEKEFDKHVLEGMTADQISKYFEVSKELIQYKFFWKPSGRGRLQFT